MKILNFGSLNIDYVYKVDHFVRKGETLSSEALHVYSGGKGLNQSVALGRAGAEVYHAGKIGKDGSFLLEVLREAGVHTDFIRVTETERSGNAIIQNDAQGDNCILLYGGANLAITREEVDETLSRFFAGDYCVLQNEINELHYIVEKAHERDMVIVLNPSPMDQKITALPLQLIDWFILNEVEAAQLTGRQASDGELLLAELMRKFPEAHIVLTLGEAGSLYGYREERFCQGIYRTEVVDTTAAGDTYTGYLLAALLAGETVQRTMALAARAAAITVSRRGAAPAIPRREEL